MFSFLADVPDAPKELVINQVWSRSVSLRWTVVQQDGQSPLIGYVIEYWRERADPNSISGDSDVISSGGSSTTVQMTDEKLPVHRLHEVHVPASQTKITLNEHLRPGLWYRVRVYAQNHLGRSRTAIERRLATQQEEPTLPPTDLRLLSRSSRRLALGWQAPPLDSWNGPLTGYLVGYRALDKKELQLAQERRLPPSSLETSLAFNTVRYQPVDPSKEQKPAHHHDDTIVDQYSQRYELESLQPATAYYVVVRAMNRVGQGPFSQPLLLFTSTVDPPSAPEVSLDSVDRNSLTIRWRLAAGDRKQITHYLISYREQQKSAQWLQRSVEAGKVPDDRFTLTALNEATSYEVVVRAAAGSELSEPSTILRLNTRTSDKSGAAFGLAERIANFRLLGSTSAAAGSTASATPLPAFFRAHVIVPLSIAMVAITLICAVAFGYVKHEEKKTALIQASMGRMAGSPSKHFQYMASASTMMGGGGGGHMPHAGPMNGGSDSSNASNSLLSSTYQTIGGPNVNDSLLSEEGSISLRYSDADKSKPLFSARPNNCSVAPGAISAAWVTNKPMGSIVEESEVMSAADEDGFPAPYSTLPMQKMTTFGQASFGETVRPNNQGPPLPSSQPPPLPANRPPSFVRIGSPVRNIQINPLGHVMNPPNAAQLVFNDFNSSANLLNLSVGADETPSVFNSTINASSSQPLLPPPMVDGSPFGAHIRHLQAEIHQPDDSDSYDFFRPTQI